MLIKLTIKHDGSPIWINFDHIQAIVPHPNFTALPLAEGGGDDPCYEVIETPDQILAAIAAAKSEEMEAIAAAIYNGVNDGMFAASQRG